MQTRANGIFEAVYGLTLIGHHWIGGRAVTGAETFESRNPAHSGDLVAVFPIAGAAEIEAAWRAAQAAMPIWQGFAPAAQAACFARLAQLLRAQAHELAALISRECGLPRRQSDAEVQSLYLAASSLAASDFWYQPMGPYQPGLSLVLSGSQHSFSQPGRHILNALAYQSCVVWKPSLRAPAVAWAFGQILQAAGLPAGALNIVSGGDQVAELVFETASGRLEHLGYAGSPAHLPALTATCDRLRLSMGYYPDNFRALIVSQDARLDEAVRLALVHGFAHDGNSGGPVILTPRLAGPFRARLLKALQALTIGDPSLNAKVRFGPLPGRDRLAAFLTQLEHAQAEGAEPFWGKGRISRDSKPKDFVGDPDAGEYVWPMVWDKLRPEMSFIRALPAGPILGLYEAADLDQAVAIAATLCPHAPALIVDDAPAPDDEALEDAGQSPEAVSLALDLSPLLPPAPRRSPLKSAPARLDQAATPST